MAASTSPSLATRYSPAGVELQRHNFPLYLAIMPNLPKASEGQEVEKYLIVEIEVRLLLEGNSLDFLPRLSRKSIWLEGQNCHGLFD